MTISYTIVEPGFEFIPPPGPGQELEFLELATRTCYKSEDRIEPGSAEKLLKKVVKEYEHLSVTEHANCVLQIDVTRYNTPEVVYDLITKNPLLAQRITIGPWRGDGMGSHIQPVIVSGNVRMWMDLLKNNPQGQLWNDLRYCLNKKWPFFFEEASSNKYNSSILDENPVTNRDNLSPFLLKKHTTLTYRLIGDRSMSHQLVRHRLCAFSQESQRYCNYGKKGFQLVMPPSIKESPEWIQQAWLDQVTCNFKLYQGLVEQKIPPEDARSLLPNCTKTEVVTTSTIENWIHIFKHRADNPKAQWQIRGIMQGIKAHMMELIPEVFHDY